MRLVSGGRHGDDARCLAEVEREGKRGAAKLPATSWNNRLLNGVGLNFAILRDNAMTARFPSYLTQFSKARAPPVRIFATRRVACSGSVVFTVVTLGVHL